MTKKETIKRYTLFIIGLFLSGMGVAFTKHGGLGVSPISSIPNIVSIKFDFLTMGTWLIIWNCILIAGQIVILRKKFHPIQLLQVPLSFLFGYFTDFGLWCVSGVTTDVYAVRLIMVILGTTTLGFGIALTVIANVIMNSGEAFVKVVADTVHKDFGNVKIVFDIFNVTTAIILSLIFFNFEIKGAREGTVIAALFTGVAVKCFTKLMRKPLERMLT